MDRVFWNVEAILDIHPSASYPLSTGPATLIVTFTVSWIKKLEKFLTLEDIVYCQKKLQNCGVLKKNWILPTNLMVFGMANLHFPSHQKQESHCMKKDIPQNHNLYYIKICQENVIVIINNFAYSTLKVPSWSSDMLSS